MGALEQKVAVITGATSGIGAAMAALFAAEGADVVIPGRRREEGEELAERLGAAAGVLSTMQQVGNALGVAVTGVIFFDALHRGFAHAFVLSVAELAALLLGVAALTRLLPARKAE
jgi:NAD(P)-dependent dehydrogenase (short-subunit alcohol dehydrogenase family)